MRKLIAHLEWEVDKLNIRKKLIVLYVFCVMLPLLFTDSIIFAVFYNSHMDTKTHEMENAANALQYTFLNQADAAAQLSKGIYSSRYLNDFLNQEFESDLDYYSKYSELLEDTLIDLVGGASGLSYTFYIDNDTIVNGSQFQKINKCQDSDWYKHMMDTEKKRGLFFGFDETSGKRKLYYFQRLNHYDKQSKNVLLVDIYYSNLVRSFENLNYNVNAYICDEEKVLISNRYMSNVGKEYSNRCELGNIGYSSNVNIYGLELTIVVEESKNEIIISILKRWPFLILLIIINIMLPMMMVAAINKSFSTRLAELSDVFNSVEDEQLKKIENPTGADEVTTLMTNYNLMADRINDLIQIVYKNTIKEQEMVVARQNAELLALHSQINPHFLFNALESIRMHSLLKNEIETSTMVEKLAKMQRQYTEWQEDSILVEKELEFVEAYLGLQKYRFGHRLSYEIEVDEQSKKYAIPKLSIVTFVENACIHGIESKTSDGWIFVRALTDNERDEFVLEIEDTGSGMNEQDATELLNRMRSANIEMLKTKGRVGMVNACLRIKMISDNRAVFDVDSEEGTGTIIQIRLPLDCVRRDEKC